MQRPNKRLRTTRLFGPSSPPSQDIDVNEARRANDLRLKSRFESIFEKYGRDFGPVGDEIDLSTGEIVINNGHLQEMEGEQDVGRGLWDEFHPDDDVEPEVNTTSPDETTKSRSQKPGEIPEGDKAHLQGFVNSPRNTDQANAYQDQLGESSRSSYDPNKVDNIPMPSYWEQSDRGSTPQKRGTGTDTLNFGSPEASSSGHGFGTEYRRGSLESPWRTPDIGARFASTLQLTTPTPKQPAIRRSFSPPEAGSIWAVPGKAGRRTHKKKPQQPKPVAASRRHQASRESPDSDDPLSNYSNPTPTSKISFPPQKESDINQPDANDSTTTPRETPPCRQERLRKEAVGFTDHYTQINEIAPPESHLNGSPEPLGESAQHETVDAGDVSPDTSRVNQDRQSFRASPVGLVEQSEGETNETTPPREIIDSGPVLATKSTLRAATVEDQDVAPTTPITEGRGQEELTSSGPLTPLRLSSNGNSEALSPHGVNRIVDLRIVQRLPWRKVLKTCGTPRPSPRQLKQLNHFRYSLKGNSSDYSQSWTAEEQEQLRSFQSDSNVSWDDIQRPFPNKNMEELQQAWIRMCFDKEPPPNVEEAGNCETPPSTALRLSGESSQPCPFSTPQSQSDPIDISEDERTTGQIESQRPESPDPLSVALESSLTGSGLSTMQIDTPPKSIRKKWSRHSFTREITSPLSKGSKSKLT